MDESGSLLNDALFVIFSQFTDSLHLFKDDLLYFVSSISGYSLLYFSILDFKLFAGYHLRPRLFFTT